VTPSYAYGFPSASAAPAEGRAEVRSFWVGVTLGTTLHPAARARP
jgi:hypothetical protein